MLSLLILDLDKGEFMGIDKRLISFITGIATALV